MRRLFLFTLVSIDGYFEGANHDLTWHNVDAEFHEFVGEQNSKVGTLLFGHRTYDRMASFWPTPQATAVSPATAAFMNETPKIVASRQPLRPEWSNTLAVTDVIEAVTKLRAQPGKDIAIFGSNNLCVHLVAAELVDEFRIMVNPVVLGTGTALFAGLTKRIRLRRVGMRSFESGNVLHYYEPSY